MTSPQHLNTTVKGSVGMLQEAARALHGSKQAAETADEAHHSARDTAHAHWQGDAASGFLNDLKPHLDTTRDLAITCEAYGRAFDDLAGMLEAVNNDMREVRDTAAAGGLRVQGPIVLRPDSPGPSPSPSRFVGNATGYGDALREHRAVVGDFNARAEVFNTCLSVFVDARNKEKQAHIDFWEAVEARQGFDLEKTWNIGTTTASAALGGLAGMDNARADLLTKVQQLEWDSSAYQKLASGTTTLSGLSAKQRTQVVQGLNRTNPSEVEYRRQLKQLDKASKYVPVGLQNFAAANPGSVTGDSKLGRQLARGFSKLPWAGSIITVFNEYRGAASGEQTWGRAVADTVGNLGGGTAGGVTGGALCAPILPPWGSIVCGTAGALLGGFAGDKVVDFVVPEETDMPQPVRKVPEAHTPINHPPRGPR